MSGKPLREALVELIRSSAYRPLTKSEFARQLKISPNHRSELRKVLAILVREGLLIEGPKARFELPGHRGISLSGTLKFHPKGNAFFFPDLTDEHNQASGIDFQQSSRIEVAWRDAGTALDGDRVRVSVHSSNKRPNDYRKNRYEPHEASPLTAKVEEVLERRSGKLVGVFHQKSGFNWCESDDKAIEGRIELTGDSTAEPGQLVVVDLQDWKDRSSTPRGRVIEVLGWPGDPGVDIEAVIRRYGLRTSFPNEILEAARNVSEMHDPREIARRKDWRDQFVFTIDPADAKDYDDAIAVEKTAKGWRLAVHIADVTHYIKPGSPMDKEAAKRGNSTYLVDRVLPMLPTELSNGICSLKPQVDRLTKCALIDISPNGTIAKARFFDAVIHSKAKLSYEQAQAILDGQPAPKGSEPGIANQVKEAWKMASALRQRRFRNGALDLDMPEIKLRLDEEGHATHADPVIHTESHQLIEECMLIANEAVARLLRSQMKPAIYRIHDDPDPSRLLDYTETAKLHGYHPGDLTNRAHIQKLLDAAKGTPEEHVIKLGLLKSLKRAAYSAEPTGHYGLAKGDYCHFTSPIRRYADVIVHRALQAFLENPPKPTDRVPSQAELRDLSQHISETERNSAEAESETKQIKLLEYLQHVMEANSPPLFDGLVTDVRPMGLMVEIPTMGIRGVVKREDLPDGRWFFESSQMAWATRDGRKVQLGMRVPLRVIAINLERRFVDFALAGKPTSAGTHTAKPAGKPKRKLAVSDPKKKRGKGPKSKRSAGKAPSSTKPKPKPKRKT